MAIQIRRGTKAGWDSNKSNIVAGEPAIATDTEQVFVGTGNGTYVELASTDYVDEAVAGSSGGEGLSSEAKQALLTCFRNVAWINTSGQALIDELEVALYPPANLRSISAVYTQSGSVYDTDTLDSLREDLVVTATYTDSSTAVVTSYTLSGSLAVGTSTITVSYGGKTTTFSVSVTEDIYNKMSYVYSNGDLVKQNAGLTWTSTLGAYLNTQQTHNRRAFVIEQGALPLGTSSDGSSVAPSDYYPIPVPADATSISVAITPNTQYFGPALYTYDGTKYTRTNDVGWQLGSWSMSFNAGQYDFITLVCKANSTGSAYSESTEPTEFTITFSK